MPLPSTGKKGHLQQPMWESTKCRIWLSKYAPAATLLQQRQWIYAEPGRGTPPRRRGGRALFLASVLWTCWAAGARCDADEGPGKSSAMKQGLENAGLMA